MPTELSLLAAALDSDKLAERHAAAAGLLQMGPAAAPASVALVEATDKDEETRNLASAVLEDLGPPPLTAITELGEILTRTTPDAPYWVATLLGRLGEQAVPAVGKLIAAAEKHPQIAVRQRAVWALGQIGPPAKSAIPTLERITAESDARLASLAKDAVAKISD